jgi:hypothetical protein
MTRNIELNGLGGGGAGGDSSADGKGPDTAERRPGKVKVNQGDAR